SVITPASCGKAFQGQPSSSVACQRQLRALLQTNWLPELEQIIGSVNTGTQHARAPRFKIAPEGPKQSLRICIFPDELFDSRLQNLQILKVAHAPLIVCQAAQLAFAKPGKRRRQRLDHITEFFECHPGAMDRLRVVAVYVLTPPDYLRKCLRDRVKHSC